MEAARRQYRQKETTWAPPLQRDPGPWSRLVINWMATLAVIMAFGLVMLYSASYTTGYLRMATACTTSSSRSSAWPLASDAWQP